jgi:hypothetical protein
MDNPAETTTRREEAPSAKGAKLAFRGAFLASLLVLILAAILGNLPPLGRNPLLGKYLLNLQLVAAFGFSLSGWGLFFLDSMCGILALTQVKLLTLAADFFLALLSLIPLALILAAQRLVAGFGS